MRTDYRDEHYWTLVDSDGKIHAIPFLLKKYLTWCDWTTMTATPIKNNQTQLLLSSGAAFLALRLSPKGDLLQPSIFDKTLVPTRERTLASTLLCSYKGDLYRACLVAANSSTGPPRVCSKFHQMWTYNTREGDLCDTCNERGDILSDCRLCDFLICENCWQS